MSRKGEREVNCETDEVLETSLKIGIKVGKIILLIFIDLITDKIINIIVNCNLIIFLNKI